MLFKRFSSPAPRRALIALAAFSFLTAPVAAFSATAIPTFEPVNQWQVGATQLAGMRGLQGMSLPCILSNEYDNGFVVRFSGGGGQILAMAIDFRQDVFQQGKKYSAMISLGDNYLKQVNASAFTANTLIFNLRSLKDFYANAKNAQAMEVTIAGNAMKFSLARLSGSYNSMEQCYAGDKAGAPMMQPPGTQQAAQSPAITPEPSNASAPAKAEIAAAPLPENYEDIMNNMPAPKATAMPVDIARVSRAERSIPQWNATAGEDIQTVLSRWADRAGYDLQWQAAQSGTVAQDLALDGTFEDAVSQLLATSGAASGITGRINQASATAPAPAQPPSSNGAWMAPAGASLKSVLDQWGARAGVDVVWHTAVNTSVKQQVTASGPFESAVQSLLDQYTNNSARPVGELNTDPQSGKRTLIMDMDRAG